MKRTPDQLLLLGGVKEAARALRKQQVVLDNLICMAVGRGVPQTEAAEAAGTSQAHVSRLVAADRRRQGHPRPRRRPKRAKAGAQP